MAFPLFLQLSIFNKLQKGWLWLCWWKVCGGGRFHSLSLTSDLTLLLDIYMYIIICIAFILIHLHSSRTWLYQRHTTLHITHYLLYEQSERSSTLSTHHVYSQLVQLRKTRILQKPTRTNLGCYHGDNEYATNQSTSPVDEQYHHQWGIGMSYIQ